MMRTGQASGTQRTAGRNPMHRYFTPAFMLLLLPLATGSAWAPEPDWPRFRGPSGTGISSEINLPTLWDDEKGIVWRSKLPGPGASSPIVVGDRIFVTSYSGYGEMDSDVGSGDPENLRRHLVCVDRTNGRILWQRSVQAKLPEAPFRPPGTSVHGYSSSTPASDGESVYAFFGKTGVFAFDLEGNQLWKTEVGSSLDRMQFGSAASPILYQDWLIVNASVEGSALLALDKRTGKEAWKAPFSGYGGSWSTPILVEAAGRAELVIAVSDEVWGLNPETGKLRWFALTQHGQPICPSVVAEKGIVYAIGGRRGRAAALRTGGKGDVSSSHLVWTAEAGAYVPSPVIHDGYLCWVNDRGIAHCLDAKDGSVVYRERLAAPEESTPRLCWPAATCTWSRGKTAPSSCRQSQSSN